MSLQERAFGPVADNLGKSLSGIFSTPATNEKAGAISPPTLTQDWQAREYALAQQEHSMGLQRQDLEAFQRRLQQQATRNLWDRVIDFGIGALVGGGAVAIIMAVGKSWGRSRN